MKMNVVSPVPGSANHMCLEEWQHVHSNAPSNLLKMHMLAPLCTSSLEQLQKVQSHVEQVHKLTRLHLSI